MKKIIHILFISALPMVANSQRDFDLIKSRIITELFAKATEVQLAKAVLANKNINPDGSWRGINYDSKDAGKWPPATHLERLQQLAIAFANPKSVYYNNSELHSIICKGLTFWYEKKPKSQNWWHNDIAAPQYLGRILLVMNSTNNPLPSNIQLAILSMMQSTQSPFNFTGANKLDIAIHYLYRALITGNEKLMNIAVLEAFQPIEFTTGEGLQHDYSYLQHKEQLMISSYGLVFLSGEYNVAAWLSGTKYALKTEKLNLLNIFFFNTFLNSLRGGYTDFNAEGRGISRPNGLNRTSIATRGDESGLLYNVSIANPDMPKEIEAISKRISGVEKSSYGIKPLHYYYWRGDYTQHVRPKYSFNVRTVSTRTVRTESGNNENLLGTVLPDGSTNIVRRGNEYYNIMPAWEWDKIPGVTCRDYDTAVIMKKNWGAYGATDFVGGVTDSIYGITVYSQDYDSVKAKKSYFFFDNEVVCLGADITSAASESINTTINQAWLTGKVIVKDQNKKTEIKKASGFKNATWIWHDTTGYVMLDNVVLNVSTDIQSGNWSDINKNNKGLVKGSVFKAWIGHGKKPIASNYAYAVIVGITEDELDQYNPAELKLISNNSKLQAVYHKKLAIIQAVFFDQQELVTDDILIKVSNPCVLQIKNVNRSMATLHIADPTQKLTRIELEVTIGKIKKHKIEIPLPEFPYAGSSVAIHIQ